MDDHAKIEKRHSECMDDVRHLTNETPVNPNE